MASFDAGDNDSTNAVQCAHAAGGILPATISYEPGALLSYWIQSVSATTGIDKPTCWSISKAPRFSPAYLRQVGSRFASIRGRDQIQSRGLRRITFHRQRIPKVDSTIFGS
eukprot:4029039-Karenia_brevis.AAC.1